MKKKNVAVNGNKKKYKNKQFIVRKKEIELLMEIRRYHRKKVL